MVNIPPILGYIKTGTQGKTVEEAIASIPVNTIPTTQQVAQSQRGNPTAAQQIEAGIIPETRVQSQPSVTVTPTNVPTGVNPLSYLNPLWNMLEQGRYLQDVQTFQSTPPTYTVTGTPQQVADIVSSIPTQNAGSATSGWFDWLPSGSDLSKGLAVAAAAIAGIWLLGKWISRR